MQTASNAENAPPYNTCNTLFKLSDAQCILEKYGVKDGVNNINLYRNALVHKSYCTRKNDNFVNGNIDCPQNCIPLQEDSYERLEFLGDAVINLIVAKYLFERYPDQNEGFLTKVRTKLVNGYQQSLFCEMLTLPKFILISKQIEENNGRNNRKILEDSFEAFIGAMFMDETSTPAFQKCETWIVNLIEENIDFAELLTTNNNFKDMFTKYFQYNNCYIPKFFEISTENTNNGKIYVVCIKDKDDGIISTGKGLSKKHAENDAAQKALQFYGQL